MNNIKLKIWDKERKYFLPLLDDGDYLFAYSSAGIFLIENGIPQDRDKYDFLLFTGLHDKNGVEIYEGDIAVSIFGSKEPFEIKFGEFNDALDECKSATNVGFYCVEDEGASPFGKSINRNMDYIEVIGNIYEHPQLLTN